MFSSFNLKMYMYVRVCEYVCESVTKTKKEKERKGKYRGEKNVQVNDAAGDGVSFLQALGWIGILLLAFYIRFVDL